jgi:HD-like signal output (HDOD) protein
MKNMMDVARFEASLLSNGIPPRPVVLEMIGSEIRKESPDLRILERAIATDVAISGGLIKMANSPYFGPRKHVRSVLEALQLLGLKITAQAVACLALRNAFPNLHLERFWDTSAKVAILSSWLVKSRGWLGLRNEDAYTLGLFRDCGIAIILQRMPSYTDTLRKANAETERPFTAVEEDVLPVAHTQVGAMMTQTWWLPEEITEAIRHHHDLTAINGQSTMLSLSANAGALIAVVHLAEHLFMTVTGLSTSCEWQKLGDACLTRLQINPDELTGLQQEAMAEGLFGPD